MEKRRLEVLDSLVEDDGIVRASKADDPHLLDLTLRQLALESARLGWQARRAKARRTVNATQLSAQRVRSLARIADLVLGRVRSGGSGAEEVPPATLAKVKEMFTAEVLAVAKDTLGADLEHRSG